MVYTYGKMIIGGNRMQEMQISIPKAGFEGPLDLLLHLIKQLEIDIYDIPMAEVTEQYLLYIHTMQELEFDVASEYLVMAATLVAIKSRMILPKHDEAIEDDEWLDVEEEDPRDELVARLIEYKKFKEAAEELKEREKERALIFTKPPSDLSEYASSGKLPAVQGAKVTIYDMLGAYHKLLRRQRLRKPLHTKVARQEISIEKRITEIMDMLHAANKWVNFFELFPFANREHIVVTFLAILELMKQNKITAEQDENFGDIWLYANDSWSSDSNK